MDQNNHNEANRHGSQDRPMLKRSASQVGFNQPFMTFGKDSDVNPNDHTGIPTRLEIPDDSGPSKVSSSQGTKQQPSPATHSDRPWANKPPNEFAQPDNCPTLNSYSNNSDPLSKWMSEVPTDGPYHAIDRVMDDDAQGARPARNSSNTVGVRRSTSVEPAMLKGSGKRHR